MIRLTLKNNNEAWYVNPYQIVSIGKHVNQEGNTYVETTVYDGDCIVTESPEEVVRKVLECRGDDRLSPRHSFRQNISDDGTYETRRTGGTGI